MKRADINKVARLFALQTEIRSLETEAQELKDELKAAVELGDYEVTNGSQVYSVVIATGQNFSIDKDALIRDYGANIVTKYTRIKPFIKITVKQIGV